MSGPVMPGEVAAGHNAATPRNAPSRSPDINGQRSTHPSNSNPIVPDSKTSTHPLLAANYDPGFCKPGHSFIDMPTLSAITYNVRTLYGMTTSGEDDAKQQRIFANIRRVSIKVDVIILQETKSPPAALYDEFEAEWLVFDNPTVIDGKVRHMAGTVVLVRPTPFWFQLRSISGDSGPWLHPGGQVPAP